MPDREPIFGPNAKWFFPQMAIVIFAGLVIAPWFFDVTRPWVDSAFTALGLFPAD